MLNNNPRQLVSVIVGATMVALGLLFLVDQLLPVSIWRYSWPFFIVIPGLLFFVGMVLGGPRAGWLAIPGSLVTTLGLVLLYQNTSGHWESWAYAWALIFPSAIGVGMVIQGTWSGQPRWIADGLRWARLGAVIFLLGGVFFEVVLDFGRGGIGRLLWPLVLIAAGAYLLYSQGGLTAARDRATKRQTDDTFSQTTVPRQDNPPLGEQPIPGQPKQLRPDDDDDEELD